jgi:hypothetical protein
MEIIVWQISPKRVPLNMVTCYNTECPAYGVTAETHTIAQRLKDDFGLKLTCDNE